MHRYHFIAFTILCLSLLPSSGFAAQARVSKSTLGCLSIGTIAIMNNYERDGDQAAVKKYKAMAVKQGKCRTIVAGTPVFFYHLADYTDGDYGAYTTIRKEGDTTPWVVDKCALDGRDPDLARFAGRMPPEKPCP